MPEFDEHDQAILTARQTMLDKLNHPRVGDWVDFANGVSRRISHIWPHDHTRDTATKGLHPKDGLQTSHDGYGYYLGEGYISFSGSLYRSVEARTLTLTEEKRNGRVWFFHHNHAQAHNGVETTIPFRVYKCNLPAPD